MKLIEYFVGSKKHGYLCPYCILENNEIRRVSVIRSSCSDAVACENGHVFNNGTADNSTYINSESVDSLLVSATDYAASHLNEETIKLSQEELCLFNNGTYVI